MNDTQPLQAVLVLNGARYTLSEVLLQAKMAPVVKLAVGDVWPVDLDDGQTPELKIKYEHQNPKGSEQLAQGELVFYKLLGKFVALSGAAHLDKQRATKGFAGEYKGRLLSSQLLKKAKIEERQPQQQEFRSSEPQMAHAMRRAYDNDYRRPFDNEPRRAFSYPAQKSYDRSR